MRRFLVPTSSVRNYLNSARLCWQRWLHSWRALAGRETLRRIMRRRSIVLALEGLEDRVMPSSGQDALTLPSLVPSPLAQTPMGQAIEQRLDTMMAAARQTYAKLLADAQQIRTQASQVLSGLTTIEMATQARPSLGQSADNAAVGPLMQSTHEALAALLVDAATFLHDLNTPFPPAANSTPTVSPPAATGNNPSPPTANGPTAGSPSGIKPFATQPTLNFSQSTYSVTEGGLATITVTLSPAASTTVTVAYKTQDGTANSASPDIDYNATNGTLTFPIGVTTETFTVQSDEDNDSSSPTETVSLSLSCPTGAVLGNQSVSTLDINEPSPPPPPPPPLTVQFSNPTYTATEGGGNAFITVTLNQVASQDVGVHYATSNGSGTAGTDYTATSGTLTITAGQLSNTFSVPILDDNYSNETSPETVNLTLSNPTGGASLGSPNPSVLDINEDGDAPPTVQFSASNYSTTESSGSVLITATLSNKSATTVTVQYATSDDTAKAGKDYTTETGTLTFAPLATSASFSVPILDDNAVNEPSAELLKVSLSNPSNATLGSPSQSTVTISEDSDGGTNDPLVVNPGSTCNCGCPGDAGSLMCSTVDNRTGPVIGQSTNAPVRYADGVVTIATTDLHSDGFGFDWGQTRSWTNGKGYATGSDNGSGWVDTYIPHLIQADGSTNNTLIFLANGNTAYYYDLVGGTYQSRLSDGSRLVYNSSTDTYTITDNVGDQIVLNGFGASWLTAQRGQFAKFIDPYGTTMTVAAYTSDGHIQEMQRSATVGTNTTTESWLYSYLTSGVNTGLLGSVTLRTKVNSGSWTTVRQVQYTYYDGTQTYGGSTGDLMTATIEDGSGNALETSYYRYYKTGEANGYAHGLKYVFNSDSYMRLTAALGTGVSNLTDAQVAPYADNYFQYDSSQRVTEEVAAGAGDSQTAGGLGTYTFSYTASSNTPDYNSWNMKTVVTNSDGSTDTVFTNYFGEVMLDDHYDPSSNLHFDSFYAYNTNAQLILAAAPSAVNGYNSSYADLLHNQNGSYQYLNNSSGLITRYDYYSTTTAGETTAGGVVNYLQDEKIQQGQTGTLIPQETYQYFAHAYNGQTIAPLASDTVYRDTDGTGAETTSYSYTWYSGTAQMQSETDTAPVISSTENGPGTADVTTMFYDTYGNVQWTKDPDGFIQYDAYDPVTGALLTDIVDVQTTDSGEFQNLPTGWTTPSGGGLNLITQDVVDALGRTTKETSPGGNITYYVYLDTQHEERIYQGWNSGSLTATMPTEVIREDSSGTYTEDLTMTATPHTTGGVPDGSEAIGSLQTLTRDYVNAAGQVTSEYTYFNLSGLTYTTSTMGTVNTNYYQTNYGYDSDGRLVRTQTPNGTIYRTVYNSLDEAVSDWVGTNDTPPSGEWSPTNNGSPANMVEVASYVYDNGGVGDGNLTQEADYPGLSAANRVTDYWYDWRDRQVAVKSGVQSSENDGTNRPIIVTTYDNLDEVTETQQYVGDGVAPTISNGVLQALPASDLRAQEIDSYDDQGRVYKTQVYDVNPSTGAVSSSALTTNFYYDHRGDLMAESDPGGLWTKSQYDGAGRDVMDYTTDGAGGTTWSAASSVANDTVLEQEQTIYDSDGNAIETIDKQRFHNATGTGALGTPTTGVEARVYYAAEYYDNADRLIADVDAGTNGGTAWTRPSSVPASSATLLVTNYVYNGAGWLQDTIDPMGIDDRTNYDNLGRVTQTIQDYTNGTETTESNISTEYGYDGNDNVTYVQADEPGGSHQKTAYVYGVTTAAGDGVNSNDVLSAVQHPDPTSGNPSSSQQDSYKVDALGEVVQATDRNGNVHQYSYDVLGRLTSDAVTTLGTGVDGTIRRIQYAYDSQGNNYLITSYNAASGGSIVNQVQDVYNGLGQLTGEYQSHSGAVVQGTTPEVQYAYNEMSNGENNSRLVSMTYPNGFVLTYNYNSGLDDSISRLSSISNAGTTLESYKYLGLSTVVELDHPQTNINLTYIKQSGDTQYNSDGGDQYTGLDRFGRVIDQFWINASNSTTVDRYQYGYDQDSDVLWRQNVVNTAMGELYTYDNLNQLTTFARGTLNANKNGISGTPSRTQNFTPDSLGNFTNVTTNGTAQTRSANQQNEYTSISGEGAITYDANGDMTADGTGNTYVYDAWNRLVAIKNGSTTLASYSYDGLDRLIQITESGTTTDLYLSSADQVLAEYQSGTATAYNIWSPVYVNALLFRDVGNGHMYTRYYVLQDANWNVTALVNTSSSVLERYAYDPYGAITVMSSSWVVQGSSAYNVPNMWQGMRYDWSVNLHITSSGRFVSPTLMRPLQTDGLGLVADNNDYRWEGDGPTDRVDPSGDVWSYVVTGVFATWDTYLWVSGDISGKEYSTRMAINLAVVAADTAAGGGFTGGGQLVRVGGTGVRVGAKVLPRVGAVAGVQAGVRTLEVPKTINRAADEVMDRATQESNRIFSKTNSSSGSESGSPGGSNPCPSDSAPLKIPQGLTEAQFHEVANLINRSKAANLGGEIVVQGSRAAGTATAKSDIDFAIKVSPEKFDALIKARFGNPNPGSAKFKTMQRAIETGKIQAGEAGLHGLRVQLQAKMGIKVDVSVIREGGSFDNPPFVPVPKPRG